MSEVKGNYPNSEGGNFSVVDTIPVPHPYCIAPKHLQECRTMVLNTDTIRDTESRGAKCDICKKRVRKGLQDRVLTIDEHETALLVECRVEIQPVPDELQQWLVSIKGEAERNGYVGFAFTKV